MFRWLSLVFLLLISCGKPIPVLEGIDLDQWKADHNGCQQLRVSMDSTLFQQREKLLALNEKQIVRLLGKPDQNELYKRNQKFYSYFIYPAPSCGVESGDSRILIIRFNAMGLAKEITIE